MRRTEQTSLPGEATIPRYDASPGSLAGFQTMVLRYYREHGRDLPWRRTMDPYAILVSEIMLQQTQVSRVEEKYPVFLKRFPDFSALAGAPLPDLLGVWQGMGYNRRALALQKCAARVTGEYGGRLPADPEILATFPGIGKATAASICAFAFGMPVVFIETNIRRVFIHYFFSDRETVTDKEILPLVERAVYRDDPCRWYNALMDLGTDLKNQVPNPNRRSASYTRQPAFGGSDRQIRGRILRVLLERQKMTEAELQDCFPGEPERVARITENLMREGFIVPDGKWMIVPSR